MSDPPDSKRTESAEITLVCPSSPRVPLAPWCHSGLVSHEQHAIWLSTYPELAADQAPPSQEEPGPVGETVSDPGEI